MGRDKKTRFPETQWSLVKRAGGSDEIIRQEALSELLHTYRPGLLNFLIKARGLPADFAEDLLQGFIADKVLKSDLARYADQGRGKFRNFILKSLNNYTATKLSRRASRENNELEFDESVHTLIPGAEVVDLFDLEWIKQVVRDAVRLTEEECRCRNRTEIWEIFSRRVVDPMLYGIEPMDYREIVSRFGISTPRQAINLLATAKRTFTRNLRLAVGKYAGKGIDIEDEIADLRKIIQR
ncbi:MAG: hypothetical protein R2940_15650 [Syntrophotaleaceae bacterium]